MLTKKVYALEEIGFKERSYLEAKAFSFCFLIFTDSVFPFFSDSYMFEMLKEGLLAG